MPHHSPTRQQSESPPAPVFAHHGETLDTSALAARWYVSPRTLANERSAGTSIPYVKRSGRVVYLLADVLAAEAAARVTPIGRAA